MIDQIIMAAVMHDERSVGHTAPRFNYLVMTGNWRMVDDDIGQPHILSTDDFGNPEDVLDVILAPDCEVVDGERLVMYTKVILEDTYFSLVVIKSRVYSGGSDE